MADTCKKNPYSQARAYELARRREHEAPVLKGCLRPYYCTKCGYWHLSSVPNRFKKERAS